MGRGRGLQSQQHACPVLRQVDGPVISPAAQPWCRAQRRKQPGAACCSPVRTHSHGYREILLSSPDPKTFPACYDFWPPHLHCVSHIHHQLVAQHQQEEIAAGQQNMQVCMAAADGRVFSSHSERQALLCSSPGRNSTASPPGSLSSLHITLEQENSHCCPS